MTTTSQNMTPDSDSLVERKRQVTRDAVVDAAIESIAAHGIGFSVQDVADRAGVTHRTVYRYFESREALIDAVAQRYEDWLAEEGIASTDSPEEIVAQIAFLFGLFDQRPELVRAVAQHTLISGSRTALSQQRTSRWRRTFHRAFPHLRPDEIEPVFAVCRTLTGSLGWFLLTTQFELTGAQAGTAVRRTVEALLADLRRQDEAAARRAARESGDESSDQR